MNYVISIVTPEALPRLEELTEELGLPLNVTLHGKGTGAEQVKKFYNITIAEEKEVFLIVAKTEEKTVIMRSILEKAGPDTPAKAIAFSLPTTEVAGFGFYRNNET